MSLRRRNVSVRERAARRRDGERTDQILIRRDEAGEDAESEERLCSVRAKDRDALIADPGTARDQVSVDRVVHSKVATRSACDHNRERMRATHFHANPAGTAQVPTIATLNLTSGSTSSKPFFHACSSPRR